MSPTSLRIRLLGELSLAYGATLVTGISTGRAQALLAYLVLQRHAPQPRQRLAFQLWVDSTDTQARTNLRKELSYLRRALPEVDKFLLVDAKTLQWHPNARFTLDVAEFEQALGAAEQGTNPALVRSALEQALELYQGDLLPRCEDDWLLPERERLQQLRIRALAQLMDLLETQRDYRAAIDRAQQLLRIDPLNEAAYCSLMRLQMLSGNRANALQIYHRCMTILREELGVEPSSSTRKLYEQVLNQEVEQSAARPFAQLLTHPLPTLPNIRPKSPLLPLIGRDHEWLSIRQWLLSMTNDVASEVLLLVGEPGIGKTRLLEELQQTMHAANGHVLWGRGFAAELVRPYGVWIDALRSLTLRGSIKLPSDLGFLLPELGHSSSLPPDRGQLFDLVVQFLTRLCADGIPVAIILDDIQWIDEASSALLHYATRLLGHLPVLFACATRPRELEDNAAILRVVQALRRERRLQTIELHPLAREHTAELIRYVNPGNHLGLSQEQIADLVFIDSGGNPLFALEVARVLSQQETHSSDNLDALIRDRLQQLNESARELVPWAAALGRSFKPTTVAQVADCSLTKLLTAIEHLEQQNIIRPSVSLDGEMGYDFAHDIVRQVAYRQLSEPRRRLMHRQIAHQLNQADTPSQALASDIAHHASLGGDHTLAASASLAAAERSLKLFAYAEAAELAQRGIQHCQALEGRTRIELHLGLLRIGAIAGVTQERATQLENEVHRLISQANALGLKDEEATGLEILMILRFSNSDFASVHQNSLRVAEASRTASPVTAARMLASGGSCLAEIGREMTRAEALLLEAQSLAARVGLAIIDIPCGLGCVQRHQAHYTEARDLLQQAWRLAQAQQDHWRECTCLTYLAMTELEADDPAAALPYCQEMATVAAKMNGEGSEAVFATALKALASYVLQQPGAEAALKQAIAMLRQVDAKRMLSYVLIGAAQTDLASDRLKLATIRAEAALQAAQTVNHFSEIALAWALFIQATLALGDRQRATTCFEALRRTINCQALSAQARARFDQVMQLMQATVTH